MVAEVVSTPGVVVSTLPVECAVSGAKAREAARYDAVLVERFTSGDATAFDEITARYREKLTAFAFTVLHDHSDAEEIAQDALIKAHRNLHRFRGDCKLSSWLHTITRNLGLNRYWYHFRRCRHMGLSIDSPLYDDSPATLLDVAMSDTPNPVEDLYAREFSTAVAESIGNLKPLHRDILEQRILQELSYDEIAEVTGTNVGTVKSRLSRAREELRLRLAAVN